MATYGNLFPYYFFLDLVKAMTQGAKAYPRNLRVSNKDQCFTSHSCIFRNNAIICRFPTEKAQCQLGKTFWMKTRLKMWQSMCTPLPEQMAGLSDVFLSDVGFLQLQSLCEFDIFLHRPSSTSFFQFIYLLSIFILV